MFRKIKRFLILLLVVAAVLAVFKPSEESFKTWIEEKYTQERQDAKADNLIEELVVKGSRALTQVQILSDFDYVNYYVFARVDAYANGKKYRYMGVATRWIELPETSIE